eukprot:TRINITY_DN5932_c0_g8_i1.p1 TRINITY_DN5932_c0_g8~~TRINITY_DN5932_c0_g8_i1.p1  ORF type:complete len:153 (+),score=1.37 TRINITY_DN5932_c0_g8_i1:775-1233(+)
MVRRGAGPTGHYGIAVLDLVLVISDRNLMEGGSVRLVVRWTKIMIPKRNGTTVHVPHHNLVDRLWSRCTLRVVDCVERLWGARLGLFIASCCRRRVESPTLARAPSAVFSLSRTILPVFLFFIHWRGRGESLNSQHKYPCAWGYFLLHSILS